MATRTDEFALIRPNLVRDPTRTPFLYSVIVAPSYTAAIEYQVLVEK